MSERARRGHASPAHPARLGFLRGLPRRDRPLLPRLHEVSPAPARLGLAGRLRLLFPGGRRRVRLARQHARRDARTRRRRHDRRARQRPWLPSRPPPAQGAAQRAGRPGGGAPSLRHLRGGRPGHPLRRAALRGQPARRRPHRARGLRPAHRPRHGRPAPARDLRAPARPAVHRLLGRRPRRCGPARAGARRRATPRRPPR